jgi:hypothetical protein
MGDRSRDIKLIQIEEREGEGGERQKMKMITAKRTYKMWNNGII